LNLFIILISFLSPLNGDICLYKSLSELMFVKLKMPSFTINNAQNRGMLNFSNSYYYKSIETQVSHLKIKTHIVWLHESEISAICWS
jgi:hypothetical protein